MSRNKKRWLRETRWPSAHSRNLFFFIQMICSFCFSWASGERRFQGPAETVHIWCCTGRREGLRHALSPLMPGTTYAVRAPPLHPGSCHARNPPHPANPTLPIKGSETCCPRALTYTPFPAAFQSQGGNTTLPMGLGERERG
jgi:hypothetical protein